MPPLQGGEAPPNEMTLVIHESTVRTGRELYLEQQTGERKLEKRNAWPFHEYVLVASVSMVWFWGKKQENSGLRRARSSKPGPLMPGPHTGQCSCAC